MLEDLLKGARRAVRHRGRHHGDDGHRRGRRDRAVRQRRALEAAATRARRWVPVLALTAGVGWTATLGLAAAGVLLLVDGAIGVAAGVAVGVVAAFGLPLVAWGAVGLRRRARSRRAAAGARARANASESQLAGLPMEVRGDWRRLEQARTLVGELCQDGWISQDAVAELDEHLVRLRKALEADRRARELGGRPSEQLVEEVADLADLLVALADEAVDHQAEVMATSTAPATLTQARDRMAALRAARREVDGIDGARGSSSTA